MTTTQNAIQSQVTETEEKYRRKFMHLMFKQDAQIDAAKKLPVKVLQQILKAEDSDFCWANGERFDWKKATKYQRAVKIRDAHREVVEAELGIKSMMHVGHMKLMEVPWAQYLKRPAIKGFESEGYQWQNIDWDTWETMSPFRDNLNGWSELSADDLVAAIRVLNPGIDGLINAYKNLVQYEMFIKSDRCAALANAQTEWGKKHYGAEELKYEAIKHRIVRKALEIIRNEMETERLRLQRESHALARALK